MVPRDHFFFFSGQQAVEVESHLMGRGEQASAVLECVFQSKWEWLSGHTAT